MKFRNEVYSELVSDLIHDAFYANLSNRGIISKIRQYAEVIARKMLDIPQDKPITLGLNNVTSGLENLFRDNELLMSSFETIRNAGNDYTCQWPLLLIHFRPLKLTHLRSGFIDFLLQSIAFTSKHKYV